MAELPCPHLMKVDVEGMELPVLRGAAATIRRCRPALHVETNNPRQNANVRKVLSWIWEAAGEAAGGGAGQYECFWHILFLNRNLNTSFGLDSMSA